MPIERVAIVYDDQDRPDTTGSYCFNALSQLVEVEHFLPGQMEDIPRTGFDLYLNVDESHPYLLADDLRPSAFWAIDTHLGFDRELAKARVVDITFAAQRDGADQLKSHGVEHVSWLPLAFDPDVHHRVETENQFDFCFVGHLGRDERFSLIRMLQRYFPRHFVGQAFFEDMARTYSASKVVFNRSIVNDINMRVFEALGCGSLLLTNDLRDNGLDELFQDGVHLATYRDPEELLDKVRFYLKNEHARERIAAAGHRQAAAGHTYLHRMMRVLEVAETYVGQRSARAVSHASGLRRGLPPQEIALWSALLAKLPSAARRVLIVGPRASAAMLAGADVSCIDPDTDLDSYQRLVHSEQLPEGEPFDAIICHQTLERSRRPIELLKQLSKRTTEGGRLIATFLNAQYHGALGALIEGNWSHAPEGFSSAPLIHYFTRSEIERLCYRAGQRMVTCVGLADPIDDDWTDQPRFVDLLGGSEDFSAQSFLLEATRVPQPDRGLTSIVILTFNQCDFTERCVEGLMNVTDPPHELIFVDNGSTDHTLDFLRSLPDVKLIANVENRGFPAAANQGIRAARGENILLLNNDVVLTAGWLERMLAALHSNPNVGIVGPRTSWPECPQQVEFLYKDQAQLEQFAWLRAKTYSRTYQEVDEIVGFCMLTKRSLIDEIGVLDESFGIGECEDKDFCMRARKAGYRLLIAHDAYVHHFGHQTFIGNGIASHYRENL